MNNPGANEDTTRDMSREEIMSALFAHLIIQNTNMALMFLGQMPNPETGERLHDVETARMFIDQLEMLEVKTKGNLTPEEQKLLQQSLMHLRMTFVQAVENPPKTELQPGAEPPKKAEAPAEPKLETPSMPSENPETESRKRFSKKF
ncbi:MAG TPA: DUF1844 domain-containing protein [Methylomirabilota bacterium]|nr:DUF1844 domain-containing protein [Methylomirabilota bacterium]